MASLSSLRQLLHLTSSINTFKVLTTTKLTLTLRAFRSRTTLLSRWSISKAGGTHFIVRKRLESSPSDNLRRKTRHLRDSASPNEIATKTFKRFNQHRKSTAWRFSSTQAKTNKSKLNLTCLLFRTSEDLLTSLKPPSPRRLEASSGIKGSKDPQSLKILRAGTQI